MTHASAPTRTFDVVIIGSGLAGLSTALLLPPTTRVAILTKRALQDGASGWAQGGIAAVLAPDDNFESHVQDTYIAGAPVRPRRHPRHGGRCTSSHRLAARIGHPLLAGRR